MNKSSIFPCTLTTIPLYCFLKLLIYPWLHTVLSFDTISLFLKVKQKFLSGLCMTFNPTGHFLPKKLFSIKWKHARNVPTICISLQFPSAPHVLSFPEMPIFGGYPIPNIPSLQAHWISWCTPSLATVNVQMSHNSLSSLGRSYPHKSDHSSKWSVDNYTHISFQQLKLNMFK